MKKYEKIEPHPIISNLIPPLAEDDFIRLKTNIQKNGIRLPILINEKNQIIDGLHRFKIGKELNIELPIETRKFDDEVEIGISLNLARRNLTPEQKKELIEKCRKELKWTQKKTAEVIGITQQRVDQVENVSNTNICFPYIPDLRMKINKKDKKEILKRNKAGETQEKIAADFGVSRPRITQILKHESEREKIAYEKLPESIQFVTADILTYQLSDVYHALITDPPYGILNEIWEPKEIKIFTHAWLIKIAPLISNFCFIFWSQKYLWEGKQWFDEILNNNDFFFQQLLIWHYPNNKSPQSRLGFKQTWEPIFFYRHKDSQQKIEIREEKWGGDLNDFDCHIAAVPQSNFKGLEMKEHPAQKPVSVMRWLVATATIPNQSILDCFCGAGTTGVACKELGRKFLGIDNNNEFIRIAEHRTSKARVI